MRTFENIFRNVEQFLSFFIFFLAYYKREANANLENETHSRSCSFKVFILLAFSF